MLGRRTLLAVLPAHLAGLLLAATFAPAAAQIRPADPGGDIGGGIFQAGYIDLDMSELNSSLVAAGYPVLEDHFLTLGGAGYGTRGRFLIGGEGHGLLGPQETTAGGEFRLQANGGYGLVRVGYLAFATAGLEVFPLLGIGGGGMDLQIDQRGAPTFGEVLGDPERSSDLSTGMFLLDASVAANYRLLVEEDDEEGGAGGILLGLQAGYTFAPGDTTWDLDGASDVAGGPDLQIEGLYLRLSIGGWGTSEEED